MAVPDFGQNIAEKSKAEMAMDFFSRQARVTETGESAIVRSPPNLVRWDYRAVNRLPR
jgi:hypothetical protein